MNFEVGKLKLYLCIQLVLFSPRPALISSRYVVSILVLAFAVWVFICARAVDSSTFVKSCIVSLTVTGVSHFLGSFSGFAIVSNSGLFFVVLSSLGCIVGIGGWSCLGEQYVPNPRPLSGANGPFLYPCITQLYSHLELLVHALTDLQLLLSLLFLGAVATIPLLFTHF